MALPIAAVVIGATLASAVTAGCEVGIEVDSTAKSKESERLAMTQAKDEAPSSRNVVKVRFPDDQVVVVKAVLDSTIRVISKRSTLEAEKSVLGVGRDHAPKGPGPVLLRLFDAPINGDVVEISFERKTEADGWNRASFGLRPRLYPRELFEMDLSSQFFAAMKPVVARTEERPHERLGVVNAFYFDVADSTVKVRVQFEAHPEMSNVRSGLPTSFHRITISRPE